MYFKVSWHQDFADLMMHLWSKYGREVFTENGIGDQMDLNKFSQSFFNNKSTTADISIDANANVGGKSVIDYAFEFPKPLQKYNSHFLLWKSLRASHGLVVANEILEKQISGEIYINDFSDIGKPYSYHPHTVISTSDGNKTMEKLFNDNKFSYEGNVTTNDDMEEIHHPDITVFDGEKHVKVSRILRHRSHTDLLRIETKRGGVLVVTEDHPFITKDHPEGINANKLKIGDKAVSVSRIDTEAYNDVGDIAPNPELAYLIGAMIGDGHTGKQLGFTQKDIKNSHFYNKFKKLFNTHLLQNGKTLLLDMNWKNQFEDWIGKGAKNKHLPDFYQKLDWEDQIALLSGVIDSDGTVNKKTGVIDIRVTSFALVQQIASLLEANNYLGCRFDRIRVSCVGNYNSEKSFKSKLPMYRVSFVCIPDEPTMSGEVHDLERWSVKVNAHKDVIFRERKKDGRWDSDEICKIEKIDWQGEWVYDITTETGRFASNGLYCHNCFNFSTYDVALEGLSMSNRMKITAPKCLESFLRQMEQFTVYAANSTLGATGLADILIVASHYVDKIIATGYDGNILVDDDSEREKWGVFTTRIRTFVSERIRSFIYTLNWEFRGNQSPFTNLSVYDDDFLYGLVDDYKFAEYGAPNIDTVRTVQKIYVEAMNDELRRSHLTFPVTTAAFYVKDGEIQDKEFLKYIAEQNLEFGFINIYYGDTSTLSSCCRLRSSTDNEYFNSFGAGSTKIGSLGVVTSNLPRLAYIAVKTDDPDASFIENIKKSVEIIGRINNAKRNIIKKRIELGAMPLYTLGHMDLSKQYSTYGITGLNEALEILGYDITSEEGEEFVLDLLDIINDENDKMAKRFHAPHNCEQVPAESSAVKLATRDNTLKYQDIYKLYSNQFIPLTTPADMLDRLRLQGKFDGKFSGGAICHINVGEQIKETEILIDLMTYAAKCGVVYWAVNYALKRCADEHIFVDGETCPECGKPVDTVVTRVVGFFTNVANWNEVRREFDWTNRQFYK